MAEVSALVCDWIGALAVIALAVLIAWHTDEDIQARRKKGGKRTMKK